MRASPDEVELTPDFQASGIMVRNLTMRKSPPPRAMRRAKKKGDFPSSSQMTAAISANSGARMVRVRRAASKSKVRFILNGDLWYRDFDRLRASTRVSMRHARVRAPQIHGAAEKGRAFSCGGLLGGFAAQGFARRGRDFLGAGIVGRLLGAAGGSGTIGQSDALDWLNEVVKRFARNGRGDFGRGSGCPPAGIGDNCMSGLANAFEHQFGVPWFEAAQVDHFGVDVFQGEHFGRCRAFGCHRGDPDQGDLAAGPAQSRLADRKSV